MIDPQEVAFQFFCSEFEALITSYEMVKCVTRNVFLSLKGNSANLTNQSVFTGLREYRCICGKKT